MERERQGAVAWFRSKDCEFFCDLAGTTQDHIVKLHDNLMYNYNTGKGSCIKSGQNFVNGEIVIIQDNRSDKYNVKIKQPLRVKSCLSKNLTKLLPINPFPPVTIIFFIKF